MLSAHAFQARRRKGDCTPLGLVINDNIIQKQFYSRGMKGKKFIPLTTYLLFIPHQSVYPRAVRKDTPVSVRSLSGWAKHVFPASVSLGYRGTPLLPHITPAFTGDAPGFSPVERDPLFPKGQAPSACLE